MTINRPHLPPPMAIHTTTSSKSPLSLTTANSEAQDHTTPYVIDGSSDDESETGCDTPPETPPSSPKPVKAGPDEQKKYPPRIWHDPTGYFKVEAAFIGLRGGKIHLRKASGVEIAMPIEKLAAKDGVYIESITSGRADYIYPLRPRSADAASASSTTTPTASVAKPISVRLQDALHVLMPWMPQLLKIITIRLLALAMLAAAALFTLGPRSICDIEPFLSSMLHLLSTCPNTFVLARMFASAFLVLNELELLEALANIRTRQATAGQSGGFYDISPAAPTFVSWLATLLISSFFIRYFVGLWLTVVMLVVSVEVLSLLSRGVLRQTILQGIKLGSTFAHACGASFSHYSRTAWVRVWPPLERVLGLLYFLLACIITALATLVRGAARTYWREAHSRTLVTRTPVILAPDGHSTTTPTPPIKKISTTHARADAPTAPTAIAVVGIPAASTASAARGVKAAWTVRAVPGARAVEAANPAVGARAAEIVSAVAGAKVACAAKDTVAAWTARTA